MGRIFSNLFFLLLASEFKNLEASPWLVGCYYGNKETVGLVDAALSTSGSCVRRCQLEDYEFAIWKKPVCVCSSHPPKSVQECSLSWTEDESREEQNGTYRVFWMRAPRLADAELILPHRPVRTDREVDLRARLRLVGNPNGFGGKLAVEFRWSSGGASFVDCRLVPSSRNATTDLESVWVTSFPTAGVHQIAVSLLNGARTVSLKSCLTIPGDLRLTLLSPDTPSCIPTHLCHSAATVVFVDEIVLLEATLPNESVTTWRWTLVFRDEHQVALHEATGSTGSRREYVFPSEGCYEVTVEALSSETVVGFDYIKLVAVEKGVSNLSFHLKHPERQLSPGQQLTFAVSFLSADPSDVFLRVSFGDNLSLSIHPHELKAEDGCQFLVLVQHVYELEGEFLPEVKVRSTTSGTILEAVLADCIRVFHPLKDVAVVAKTAYTLGEEAGFSVRLPIASQHVEQYRWELLSADELFLEHAGKDSPWRPFLNQTGKYVVTVTVSNSAENVVREHEFLVQEPVAGLKMRTRDSNSAVALGETRRFRARFGAGTNVTCRWHISPACRTCIVEPRGCRCRVTFDLPGHWKVVVEARNAVSMERSQTQVDVEEGIEDMHVAVKPADGVVEGGTLTFLTAVSKGTDVTVKVKMQDEREATAEWDEEMELYVAEVRVDRSSPGRTNTKVEAVNRISRKILSVEVMVMKKIRSPKFTNLGCISYGVPAVFSAKTKDTQKGDLFIWKTGRGRPYIGTVPFASLIFHKPGPALVKLIVRRGDQTRRIRRKVLVHPTCAVQLQHEDVVRTGDNLTFLLKGVSLKTSVYVSYGRHSKDRLQKSSVDSPHFTWQHMFPSPSVVVVKVTADRNNISVVSAVQVQTVPSAVNLRGPRRLRIWSVPVAATWEAVVKPKPVPNLLYQWSVGHSTFLSASPKFTIALNKSGEYQVQVKASNRFGQVEANITVAVSIAVSCVKLSAQPTPINHLSHFLLQICGQPKFNVTFDFGDGTSKSLQPFSDIKRLKLTFYELNFTHRYLQVGHYKVWTSVSNGISSLNAWTVAAVEDPVVNLSLELLSPSLVALFHEVCLRATIGGGSWPEFFWDFGDDTDGEYTDVESQNNGSIARHSYGMAGTYRAKLVVKNTISTMSAELPVLIKVVEPIERLHLQRRPVPSGVYGIALSGPSTPPVHIEAHIWRGSDVEFIFDYGDGTEETVFATFDMRFVAMAVGKHVYQQKGVYSVKVTARNPLGSLEAFLDHPIYVQYQPKNLFFSQPFYVTGLGLPVDLKIFLSQGTNVGFEWWIDGKLLKNGTDMKVTLKFNHTGMYKAKVIAYNYVTPFWKRPELETRICIQEPVTRVVLHVLLPHNVTVREGMSVNFPTGTSVTFEVKVFPEPQCAVRFTWNIGLDSTIKTISPRFQHSYDLPGSYIASVAAKNYISEISSGAISLYLIQKISNRASIRHLGTSVVGSEVLFQALYSFGSNLTFTWDFGDGSALVVTPSGRVHHTFLSLGEFWITVNIKNDFSDTTVKSNIFILDTFCQKPQMNVVAGQSIHVDFSDPIVIEIDLTVNCTSEVEFQWTVVPLPNGVTNNSLCQRDLYFASRTFPFGHYKLQLKVTMIDTIVYETIEADLYVHATEPAIRLNGGVIRSVGQMSRVTISSTAFGITETRYKWHCLGIHNQPCFPSVPQPPDIYRNDVSEISFSAEDLNPQGVEFQLTAFHGNTQFTASQIVEVVPSTTCSLSVECLNCEGTAVNGNKKLVFRAHQTGCELSSEQFNWQLWLVYDGSQLASSVLDYYECVQDDGSVSYWLDSAERSPISIPKKTDVAQDKTNIIGPQNGIGEVSGTTLGTSAFSTSSTFYGTINSSETIVSITEERNVYTLKGMDAFPEFEEADSFHAKIEGLPGEAGSAGARSQDFLPSEDTTEIKEAKSKGRHDGQIPVESEPRGRDRFQDNFLTSETTPRITGRPREAVALNENQTLTGLESSYLVIRDGVLRPGGSYLVQVSSAGGRAMEYVSVMKGPSKGRCHVTPSVGMELETVFRLHCLEWKSERLPIRYGLTYSLDLHSASGHLIYKGLKANAKFILPAGLKRNKYIVFIKVVVESAKGATTNVCVVKCTVFPSNESRAAYIERWNSVEALHLKKLISEKKYQTFFHNIHVMASSSLQHTNYSGNEFSHLFMAYFKTSNFGKQVLPEQVFSSLMSVLQIPELMRFEELNIACEFVTNYTKQIMLKEENAIGKCLPVLATLLQKLLQSELYDQVKTLRQLLHLLLNNYLHKLITVEHPIVFSTTTLELSYGYIGKLPFEVDMRYSNVKLSNYAERARRSLHATEKLGVILEVFSYNPFPKDAKFNVQSVVSLNVIEDSILSRGSSLVMHVWFKNVLLSEAASMPHSLNSNFANIHSADINFHMHVSIQIRFLNGSFTRDFPVEVSVGNSVEKWFERTYDIDEKVAKIFLHINNTQEKGQFNVTLLCARNKCHRKQNRTMLYQIDIWEHRCLYRQNEWWIFNSSICNNKESERDSSVLCRCQNIGMVGVDARSIVHKFKTVSVNEFHCASHHLAAIILLVVFGLAYIAVLPWCYRADLRNSRNPALTLVRDNRHFETHSYIVTVQTGSYWDAGTTAAVFMVLHGNKGLSVAKCITGPFPHTYLHRSAVNHFLFSTTDSLGEIWKVQVWHNNTGPSPSWFLRSLVVTDLSTGKKWSFECNQWLSVEDDDGQIEKEFLVSETGWKRWSTESFLECLSEFHLWSSVFLAPSNSSLSHSLRLICCLVTATFDAALTAFAFNFFTVPNASEISGTSLSVWIIGALTSGIVFAAVQLLVLLLKQLSPTIPHYNCNGIMGLSVCPLPTVHCYLPQKTTSRSSHESLRSDRYNSSLDNQSDYYSYEESTDESSSGMEAELEASLSQCYEIVNWARRKHEQRVGYPLPLAGSNAETQTLNQDNERRNEILNSSICHVMVSCIAWFFMVALVVMSAALICFETKWFDQVEILYWIQSCVFAILCDICLFHSVLMLFVMAVKHQFLGRVEELPKYASNSTLTSEPIPQYRPPSEVYLIEERCRMLRLQIAMQTFKNFIKNLIILILLVLLTYDHDYNIQYLQNAAVRNVVTRATIQEMKSVSMWIRALLQDTDYLKTTGNIFIGQPMLYTCSDATCSTKGFSIFGNESSLYKLLEKKNVLSSVLKYVLANPTFGLFTSVEIFVDIPSDETTPTIQTFYLRPLHSLGRDVVVGILLTFAVLWMLKMEIWSWMKTGRAYFSNFWNCLQLSFIVVAVAHQCTSVYCHTLSTTILHHHQETNHWVSFADFQHLANCKYAMQALQGMLLFLHICTWLRIFKANRQIARAISIVKKSFQNLLVLWILWVAVLFGYVLSYNLSEPHGRKQISACLPHWRNCLRSPTYSTWTLLLHLVALVLFLFIFALMRATLISSGRAKISNDVPLTAGEFLRLVKEHITRELGWSLCIVKGKIASSDTVADTVYHRPLEFVLFDLDRKADIMLQAAESLFVVKDAKPPLQDPVVPVALSSQDNDVSEKPNSYSKKGMTTSNNGVAVRNRVRKTRPLRIRHTVPPSSSSSEDCAMPHHRSVLRKTKSRGKGKNFDLHLESSGT